MAYELSNARVYQGFKLRIGNEREGEVKDFDAGGSYGREVSVKKNGMENS